MGQCGRSRDDLSFKQKQALIKWFKFTADSFVQNCWNGMCLKVGEDV